MDPLFPTLPEDLSAVTDEQLTEFRQQVATLTAALRDGTAELPEGIADTDVFAQAQAAVAESQRAKAALNERAAEAEAGRAELERLAAEADVEDAAEETEDEAETEPAAEADDDTTDADGDETEGDEAEPEAAAETEDEPEAVEETADEPEAVAAAAEQAKPRLRRPPAASPDRQPRAGTPSMALVASSGLKSFRPGQVLDLESLAQALAEADSLTTVTQPGVRQQVIVASAAWELEEARRLDDKDYAGNTRKIRALRNQIESLVAAGGLCAPLTNLYASLVVAVGDRPVRDAFAGFQATRGGITFPPPLSLADAENAIGVMTAAEDGTPGSATKPCLTFSCDEFNSAEIYAISACAEYGNFTARTWPERVEELTEVIAAQHARNGEVELLDALTAGSKNVTDAAVYGATSSLIQGIAKAAAGIRSSQRMGQDTQMRVLLPAWVADMLVADLAHGQFDRFHARTEIETILGRVGVNVTWYLDGKTGGGQVFAAQSDGAALLDFPTTVVWYIYPEGTWLFLDGGRLDLGIVRDSTLNATNDFQVFYETFEGAAKIGVESYEVTSTVCPSGATAGPDTLITC